MSVVLVLLAGASYRDKEIKGSLLCGLLALLADDLRSGCGTARLVEELWPQEQPENPTKALHVLVSRARALLGADALAATPTGYRLTLREDQVDACAVMQCDSAAARHLRAGEHTPALARAEAGLAMWQGTTVPPPVPGDPLSVLRAARAATHGSLRRTRALALARLGRSAEAIEPLGALLPDTTRDEEVLAELLRWTTASMSCAVRPSWYAGWWR